QQLVRGGGLHGGNRVAALCRVREPHTEKAVRVCVERRPGQVAAIAYNIAVDDVADTAENLTGGSEERSTVKRDQGIDALSPRAPEQHRNAQEERAKEGHTALPSGQDMPGLREIKRDKVGLLDDKIQATANQSGDDTPP